MHTRQWQRPRLLWLAVAGLCVLRRDAWLRVLLWSWARLPLHVLHAPDPPAARVCSLASPFGLVPATSRASVQKKPPHTKSSAIFSSSMAGSRLGIIIKSMPQLHRARLFVCVCKQRGQCSGLVCVDSRGLCASSSTAEAPMQCSPRSLMGWQRGSRSGPPITSGGKLAKWIGPCTYCNPEGM